MDGWIKLHRKIRNNPIFNDYQLFRLWVICLTEAYHKATEHMVGKQMVKLDAGQFVTGRFELHSMYNRGLGQKDIVSDKTTWRWLEKLEIGGFLTINSTNKYSIVTVANWHLYQLNDQQTDQQMTNKRPSDDQQMTTNKNVKNDNNDENGEKKNTRQKRAYAEDSSPYLMALYLYNKIMIHAAESGVAHLLARSNLQSWADECRKLLEIDKVEKELIRDVIDWSTANEFWKTNILSAATLREKFAKLAMEMKKEKRGNTPNDPTRGKSGKPSMSVVKDEGSPPKMTPEEEQRLLDLARKLRDGG